MVRYLATAQIWVYVKLRNPNSQLRNFITQLTAVSTEGVLLYWRFAECDTEQILANLSFDIWKSGLKINSKNIAINIQNPETEPHFYNAIQPSINYKLEWPTNYSSAFFFFVYYRSKQNSKCKTSERRPLTYTTKKTLMN